ncbi:hypothetical protein M8J77_005855 [Diaphorina citri]|nr:hypothetical protein M8J77_005855 [Diaphorina citri]
MSEAEQYFILNKFRCDLVTMRENAIKANKKNFELLNRIFEPQAVQPVKKTVKEKTPYDEAVINVRKKTALKNLEEKKRYLEENTKLYQKLSHLKSLWRVGESWKAHLKKQKKFLDQKKKEREFCKQAIDLENARDAVVLDKYRKRVAQIRKRRAIEMQKENLKNARGIDFVTCADFVDIVQELSDFKLENRPGTLDSLNDSQCSYESCENENFGNAITHITQSLESLSSLIMRSKASSKSVKSIKTVPKMETAVLSKADTSVIQNNRESVVAQVTSDNVDEFFERSKQGIQSIYRNLLDTYQKDTPN